MKGVDGGGPVPGRSGDAMVKRAAVGGEGDTANQDEGPTELEYLRSDVSALRDKLARLQGAMHQALMLHANGEPHVPVLQEAMRQILGEHSTSYMLRESPDAKTQRFETWQERERAIAKLRAAGVSTIEIAELPARSCMVTPWYRPRAAAKRASAKRR